MFKSMARKIPSDVDQTLTYFRQQQTFFKTNLSIKKQIIGVALIVRKPIMVSKYPSIPLLDSDCLLSVIIEHTAVVSCVVC